MKFRMMDARNSVTRALLTLTMVAVLSSIGGFGTTGAQPNSIHPAGTPMKIAIKFEDTVITATLDDNPTSRDFVSLLPIALTLEDYAATEKISYLPRKLSTEGAPPGSTPTIGDISYYAPWGNLAVFYKDFRDSPELIKLGKIQSAVEALNRPGKLKVTIELVKNQP